MTQSQLQPQSDQKGKMSGDGKPKAVSENTSSGGGTYNQSAGPLGVAPQRPPPQPDQAQGMPKGPSAKIPPSIPKGTASSSGPESVRPKNAPSTGDRGVA